MWGSIKGVNLNLISRQYNISESIINDMISIQNEININRSKTQNHTLTNKIKNL